MHGSSGFLQRIEKSTIFPTNMHVSAWVIKPAHWAVVVPTHAFGHASITSPADYIPYFSFVLDHLVSTSIDTNAAIITAHMPPDTPNLYNSEITVLHTCLLYSKMKVENLIMNIIKSVGESLHNRNDVLLIQPSFS